MLLAGAQDPERRSEPCGHPAEEHLSQTQRAGRTDLDREARSALSERTPWKLMWWGGDGEGEGGKGGLRWPGARSQKDPLIPQLPAFGNHLENFKNCESHPRVSDLNF